MAVNVPGTVAYRDPELVTAPGLKPSAASDMYALVRTNTSCDLPPLMSMGLQGVVMAELLTGQQLHTPQEVDQALQKPCGTLLKQHAEATSLLRCSPPSDDFESLKKAGTAEG